MADGSTTEVLLETVRDTLAELKTDVKGIAAGQQDLKSRWDQNMKDIQSIPQLRNDLAEMDKKVERIDDTLKNTASRKDTLWTRGIAVLAALLGPLVAWWTVR